MIKEIVVGLAAATIISCGGIDEVVEKEVVGIRPFSLSGLSYVAVAYDLDKDGVVDFFDLHLINGNNEFGWYYLGPVIDTRYDSDYDQNVIDGLELD